MSGRIVADVLDNAPADLTLAQMLVLVSLAESATDRDRTARYNSSTTDLARRTRLGAGTVRNTVASLAKRGLIRPVHARGTVLHGKVQEYQIARLATRHRFATWDDADDPEDDQTANVTPIRRPRT